jgi:hypothetical protein
MKSNLVQFEWINYSDHQMQLFRFRKGVKVKDDVIVVCIYQVIVKIIE